MTSDNSGVFISGTGSYAPARTLTNRDLAEMVDTSDQWIRNRTGIRERRIAGEEERTSTMGSSASAAAIKDAGIHKDDIDLVLVATLTPDMFFPSTACLVQTQLGLRQVTSFDLGAACSGFIFGLEVASNMMKNGNFRHALVIGSEKLSSILDWEDRKTCVLFGDGAGAVVLSSRGSAGYELIDFYTASDGAQPQLLHMPGGGSACPATPESLRQGRHFLKMQGQKVFKVAVRLMEQSVRKMLDRHGLSSDDIALIIPHQANLRIIETLARNMKAPKDKFFVNLDRWGNTSAASIPIALDEASKKNCLRAGDYVLLVAFGAGLTWGSTLLKWK